LLTQDCAALESEDIITTCLERAASQEPLRPGLIAYCESASQSYFRCAQLLPVESCTQSAGIFEDAVLQAAQACHASDCEELQGCEQAVFEDGP
jgi:hypothetical protein